MKKAAIYARVSSQRQKEEQTIDSQVNTLVEFGSQQGFDIPKEWIFLDNGVSGQNLQRPALDELRDIIKVENVDALLIYAPDRLSRILTHQLILLEEFRKHLVKVFFIKNGTSGETPEEVMSNQLQGVFAEYERALILDRSRRGRIHKAKIGDPSILPSLSYGYCRKKIERQTVIEIVEEKASIIRQIFRFYIYDNCTLNEIGRRLSEKGIKSPKGNTNWHRSTLVGILTNKAYIGSAFYGKTEKYEGKVDKIRHYKDSVSFKTKCAKRSRSEEEWFEIKVPPLISESDFELAQEHINKNKELALRNTREPSLLQGLVICAECGYPFYKKLRKAKSYYYCRSYMDNRIKKCNNKKVEQKELDDLVYAEIVQMLQNPILIRQELQRREKENQNTQETTKQQIAIKKDLENLKKERDRLLDAYQSGAINLEMLSQRNQSLDKKRNAIDKDVKALQTAKLTKEVLMNWEKNFEEILERIKTTSPELSFKEKQQLVRLIIEKVVISKEEIKIMHCVSPQNFQQKSPLCCVGVQWNVGSHPTTYTEPRQR